jgi:hypothetical protein
MNRKHHLIILAIFILSRTILYQFLGVAFDSGVLVWGMQLLDLNLLENNLLESIFYLHSQPPIFNLLVGLGLKVFGANGIGIAANIVFLLLGLMNAWLIYECALLMKIGPKLSLFASLFFMLSPSTILFENYLFYTYPIVSLLILSLYFLLKYNATKQTKFAVFFIYTLACICLTRSLFHISWFVAALVLVIYLGPTSFKSFWKYSVLPICLVFLWHFKNLVIFGFFGTSSWLGMSWTKMCISRDAQVNAEISSTLSPNDQQLFAWGGFTSIENLQTLFGASNASKNIEVLDQMNKSNGATNYNHIIIPKASNEYKDLCKTIIQNHPEVYLRNITDACFYYLRPAYYYFIMKEQYNGHYKKNTDKLSTYIDFLGFDPFRIFNVQKHEAIAKVALPAFFFIAAIGIAFFSLMRKENRMIFAYMLLTIMLISSVSNLFEIGENDRFRYLTFPFVLILILHAFRKKGMNAVDKPNAE